MLFSLCWCTSVINTNTSQQMRPNVIILIYFTINLLIANCDGFFDIFSIGGAAMAGAGVAGMYKLYDYLSGRCSIHYTKEKLIDNLRDNLVGQHIVYQHVIGAVHSHLRDKDPPHALSLVFSGSTGTGKNYVAQLIAESIHTKGLKSNYVHVYSGRYHFPLESRVNQYKSDLQEWVKTNVSACPHSIFIFDEIDKMPAKILDSIKPFLDYSAVHQKVDFRQAIFIFLTNLGGLKINQIYRKLRESGVVREEMNYVEFESDLRKILFDSTEGMFQDSDTIKSHLISQYLPFLPLEKTHVATCIRKEIQRRGGQPTKDRVAAILNYIDFYNDLWSLSGCKRISDHVSALAGKWD